jgi:hypothetical protein
MLFTRVIRNGLPLFTELPRAGLLGNSDVSPVRLTKPEFVEGEPDVPVPPQGGGCEPDLTQIE